MGAENSEKRLCLKAAVFAFLFQEDKLLIIERALEPYKGQKTIPGGHVRVGETFRQACRREIKEETGYSMRSIKFIGFLHSQPADLRKNPYLSVYYLCRDFFGQLSESSEGSLQWVAVKDIAAMGNIHPALVYMLPDILQENFPLEVDSEIDINGISNFRLCSPRD